MLFFFKKKKVISTQKRGMKPMKYLLSKIKTLNVDHIIPTIVVSIFLQLEVQMT